MQTLVNYLVRISDVTEQTILDETDRNDTANDLRLYVEDLTERYHDNVFDWRETETAGGWSDKYPENVLFAADDPQLFVTRLVEIRNRQKKSIDECLHRIAKICETTDLAEIVRKIESPNSDHAAKRYLRQLADRLGGRFTSESNFYNCESETSVITDETLDAIRKNPEEWAIVLFDQHS